MITASASVDATSLTFTGMKDLGILHGFDLHFSVKDKSLDIYLCLGRDTNRVKISGTTPKSRQADVLKAIDTLGKWSQVIELWMIAEKQGTAVLKTPMVEYVSHVKPFGGKLCISGIAADSPKMTYPGNGKGRMLSKPINGCYYFIYGGKLEVHAEMRGFDCTSFPMALLSVASLPSPGYGKQLCDALGATQCNHEQISSVDMAKKFREDTVPVGIYVLFSAGHVLLYNSNINVLYEFTHGGFKSTPAGQRTLHAPQNLWWLRKLPESYRSVFS